MLTKICNSWSSSYPFLILTRILSTGWSLCMVWCTLRCGGVVLDPSWSSSSLSPPWSMLSSSSWVWSSSCSSSWSCSWFCVGAVVSIGDRVSLGSCGHTFPIAILYKASQWASSSSTTSRSYCSTWEPLVLSNTVSHVVSTQSEFLLKTRYVREFES
jgi:hypothetical protein